MDKPEDFVVGSPRDDFEYDIYDAFEKAEHPSDKWYPYLPLYDKYLSEYRLLPSLNLVEVGVQKGGSLDMWGKYFPNATITGIDIDPACYDIQYTNKNIQVVIGDAGDPKFWDDFLIRFKDSSIDIFIDDGGHFMNQQITTLEKVWKFIAMDGIYICEDAHTSYMPHNGGGLKRPGTFIEYAKSLVDLQHIAWTQQKTSEMMLRENLYSDLRGVYFHNSFVVMEKNHPYFDMVRISNRDDQGNKCLKIVT